MTTPLPVFGGKTNEWVLRTQSTHTADVKRALLALLAAAGVDTEPAMVSVAETAVHRLYPSAGTASAHESPPTLPGYPFFARVVFPVLGGPRRIEWPVSGALRVETVGAPLGFADEELAGAFEDARENSSDGRLHVAESNVSPWVVLAGVAVLAALAGKG